MQCGTCMAILQDVDDEQMEQLEAEAQKREEAQTASVECPKCGARNSPKARRCVECGTRLEAAVEVKDQSAWEYGTWAVFGGIGFLVFLVMVIAIWAGGGSAKRNYAKATVSLALKFNASSVKRNKTKREAQWNKDLKDQYVKWRAVAVKIDGDSVDFAVSTSAIKSKKGEIRVEFEDGVPDELKKGKPFYFDAKLDSYNTDGYSFLLTEGRPVETEDE